MCHETPKMLISRRPQLLNGLRGHLTDVGVIGAQEPDVFTFGCLVEDSATRRQTGSFHDAGSSGVRQAHGGYVRLFYRAACANRSRKGGDDEIDERAHLQRQAIPRVIDEVYRRGRRLEGVEHDSHALAAHEVDDLIGQNTDEPHSGQPGDDRRIDRVDAQARAKRDRNFGGSRLKAPGGGRGHAVERNYAMGARSSGVAGAPFAARYSGLAQTTRRTDPSRVEIRLLSGNAPMRIATSI